MGTLAADRHGHSLVGSCGKLRGQQTHGGVQAVAGLINGGDKCRLLREPLAELPACTSSSSASLHLAAGGLRVRSRISRWPASSAFQGDLPRLRRRVRAAK